MNWTIMEPHVMLSSQYKEIIRILREISLSHTFKIPVGGGGVRYYVYNTTIITINLHVYWIY